MPGRIGSFIVGLVVTTVLALLGASAAQSNDPQLLTSALGRGIDVAQEPLIAESICLPDTSPASLNTLFDSEPANVIGADYPRTLELSDGNVLWTFQDAKVRMPDGAVRVVHNIGVMQVDNCFNILIGGTPADPRSWMFAADTVPQDLWYWPLDAEIGSDGRVYIFSARMDEQGAEYLTRTVPTGTFVARFNPYDWNIEWYGSATNASADLYGWSIESDDEWTYLFAQCHRQFGFDPYIFVFAHDQSCTDRVTVGRVPRGRIFDVPTYWTSPSALLVWVSAPHLDRAHGVWV